MGNRGGRRPGAGAKRKWSSEAARKRAERFEKRTAAQLLEGEQFEAAYGLLFDLLDENPAAFDYWAWLRYYAKYPDERPFSVNPRRAKQLLRAHPLTRLEEWAVVEAAQILNLLPWQSESAPADWAPFVDLLPWATKKGASEWRAPRVPIPKEDSAYGVPEWADEIAPRIIDNRQVFSFDDALEKPNKEES